MGFNVRVYPIGDNISCAAHAVSVAARTAMIFGNITPGDKASLQEYTFNRFRAFINAFGPLDEKTVACGAGAIYYGFPVITHDMEYTPSVPKSLIKLDDVSKWNTASLEARDIKIKITNIDIPVSFATAFEGEIIRRGVCR